MDFSSHASLTSLTAHLRIDADRDPQIARRVLDRFAERGELPQTFSARIEGVDALRLEIEFDAGLQCARHLARRLQNLPSVRSIALTFRHNALPAKENPQPARSA
ncbi:MAG: hypothetical protein JWR16_2092 [Nevskia sp.]|nr:hypothetical protein [Nevskia sp.]